jgi:long-chain acyl-CoA synthetase
MGGSAVSPELRERIGASFSGVKSRVSSLYGLTEAGGVLAAGSGIDVTNRPGCVGRALPVVELRITNPARREKGRSRPGRPPPTGATSATLSA